MKQKPMGHKPWQFRRLTHENKMDSKLSTQNNIEVLENIYLWSKDTEAGDGDWGKALGLNWFNTQNCVVCSSTKLEQMFLHVEVLQLLTYKVLVWDVWRNCYLYNPAKQMLCAWYVNMTHIGTWTDAKLLTHKLIYTAYKHKNKLFLFVM